MKFMFHTGDFNHHGTQKKGEPWNQQTVRGPKLKWLKLERKSPGFSRRLIFYFPSGKCWYFDVYSKRKEK
jgi:hypothetical protein